MPREAKLRRGSSGDATIPEERSNFSFGEGKGHLLGRMLVKGCTYLGGSCFAIAKLGSACRVDSGLMVALLLLSFCRDVKQCTKSEQQGKPTDYSCPECRDFDETIPLSAREPLSCSHRDTFHLMVVSTYHKSLHYLVATHLY